MLNQIIKEIHFYISSIKQRLVTIKNNIIKIFPESKSNEIIDYQQVLNNNIKHHNLNSRLSKKFDKLKNYKDSVNLNLHNTIENNNDFQDPWLINLSDTYIPKGVSDILRLGVNFNSQFTSYKKDHIFEIVEDIETNLMKFPEECHDEIRHKVLSISSKYLKKPSQISDVGKTIVKGLKLTREFTKNNKDLLVINPDKGNITVILKKQNYLEKMKTLLDDSAIYEKIDSDPLPKLQKTTIFLRSWMNGEN